MPNVHDAFRLIFFSERPSVPSQFAHRVSAEGMIAEEVSGSQVLKGDWTRELEVDVVMTTELAAKLLIILSGFIKAVKKEGSEDEKEAASAP